MRYAISTEGASVSAHFGRCPNFTLVDIEEGAMQKKKIVTNPGHEVGAIPRFLHGHGVKCVVAGGMGRRAQTFFEEFGMTSKVGISGLVDDIIGQLVAGTLKGGVSLCSPGAGRGYGVEKNECDHGGEGH